MKIKKLYLLLAVFTLLFTMSVVVFAEDNTISYEVENNNTPSDASSLEIGIINIGNLSGKSDVDYYKLQTISTGDVLFHFTPHADGVYAYYWYAQVLDENMSVLKEGTLSGNNDTDFSIKTVKPGTYYLRISAISGGNPLTNGFTTDPYMVSISTVCLTHAELKDWEYTIEPSCSQEGERVRVCSACNTVVATETVAKLQHSYTEWSVSDEAELFKAGEKKRTCELCGNIETKSYFANQSIILITGVIGGIIILIVVISVVKKAKRKKRRSSFNYYGSSSRSSSYNSSSNNYHDSSSSGDSSGYVYTDRDFELDIATGLFDPTSDNYIDPTGM